MSWSHLELLGDAAVLHDREPPPQGGRAAWWFDVSAPALVLGSSQRAADVDAAVAASHGLRVVRRRSGGGAVLLWPGEFVWLDVVVPAGDPLWDDDVARAAYWIGEVWAEALSSVGVAGRVHRGRWEPGRWGRQVCFAGVGPGEVLAGDRKLVGVSQRRTRHVARLQTMCHLQVRAELMSALVATTPSPAPQELLEVIAPVDAGRAALVAALRAALDTR